MDIIQLLELLKPAKEVVTVQVVNQKDLLAPWIDLIKAVLPAAATAGVAWLAMNKSHRQFESNSKRQSAEFKLGIEQQVKSLKIQTQLATEVDLKKDICRAVRETNAQFLTFAMEANRQSYNHKTACEMVDKGNLKFIEERNEAHRLYMKATADMSSARIMLMSYLNPINDEYFYNAIGNVNDQLQEEAGAMGRATGLCLVCCRQYIENKQNEIIALTASITDRDTL